MYFCIKYCAVDSSIFYFKHMLFRSPTDRITTVKSVFVEISISLYLVSFFLYIAGFTYLPTYKLLHRHLSSIFLFSSRDNPSTVSSINICGKRVQKYLIHSTGKAG